MEQTVTFPDGRSVCKLGQGTYKMGISAARRDDEMRALRHGIELGLSVIDTAEMYGNEEFVGEAIRGVRDKVFIVSKVLPCNADYTGTKRACERSLRRLGVERIDLYLLHWIGRHPFAETVRALAELRSEGKIGMWGMSNLDVADMEHIISLPQGRECSTDQVLYNLESRGVEYDLLPWCSRHNMPVMAYSPVGEGRLSCNQTLERIAKRHKATPAPIALAWTMRSPGIIAIPKAGSISHVNDNYNSLTVTLNDEDQAHIDAAFPPPRKKIPLAGW